MKINLFDPFLFSCCLAAPRPTLGYYRGGSLTHPMLIICVFLHIRPEDHREPRNEVEFLSPAERLVGFESETFRFWSPRLNPLGYSPHFSSVFHFYTPCKRHKTKGFLTFLRDIEMKYYELKWIKMNFEKILDDTLNYFSTCLLNKLKPVEVLLKH